MSLSKNQRFGLITFAALIAASVLVTWEPWKDWKSQMETSLGAAPPAGLSLSLRNLSAGYPASPFPDPVHSYRGFDLAYNEDHEQASWVAYVITREEVEQGLVPRSDDFRPDTLIRTGSASLADYRGSGFDRGHLAPAADMKWDPLAMSESFLMSNMSPQPPAFNRNIWRRLEEQVRQWALEKDSLFVVTGPVLSSVNGSIGTNQVGIPGYYFKVLADLSPPEHTMIAFLVPTSASREDFMRFAITVDSLEQFTGYDFFAMAGDPQSIDWLEAHLLTDHWR